MRLLLAGGALDPHLDRVGAAARARGLEVVEARTGPGRRPRLHLEVPGGRLRLDGQPLEPDAVFLRHDVFEHLADPRPAVAARASDWYEALLGFLHLNPAVRAPNRPALGRRVSKIAALGRAAALGLAVPRTLVTNELDALRAPDPSPRVAKPLRGGGLCLPLARALAEQDPGTSAAPSPAFVQEALVGPELRVTLLGERAFTFEILTDALDHRADPAAPLRPAPLDEGLRRRLVALARDLGLTDLCAADLKRCPASGEPVLLEVNAQPMFMAYDTASGGALVEALLDRLTRSDEG